MDTKFPHRWGDSRGIRALETLRAAVELRLHDLADRLRTKRAPNRVTPDAGRAAAPPFPPSCCWTRDVATNALACHWTLPSNVSASVFFASLRGAAP
jgi:hypothetical protein